MLETPRKPVNACKLCPRHTCGTEGHPLQVFVTDELDILVEATCPHCGDERFYAYVSLADAFSRFETHAA